MSHLRYIALIGLVIVVAMAAVLWQNHDNEEPKITFTRPASDLEDNVSDPSLAAQQGDADIVSAENAIVPLTEPLAPVAESTAADQNAAPSAQAEEAVDDAQLAEQIKQAQAKLAQVEAINAQKQALVERELAQENSAGKSLLEAELAYQIGGWRQAWRTKNVDQYFRFYSDKFRPDNGKTVEQWKAQRVRRLDTGQPISLDLEDFQVAYDEQTERSLIRFKQHYQSGSFDDTVQKKLIMVKEQGEWRILSEVTE